MIPAEFDYVAPDTLDEALTSLADGGPDAKALAGGHSLLPLMKLRLAAPTLLVDLRRVPGIRGVSRDNGTVRIGAMTTHHEVAMAGLGLASSAAQTIADQQVRNRGTLGGTLAHGDPASDMPAVFMALEGSVTAMKPGGAAREIAWGDLFRDYLETALEPGELITEVRVQSTEGWGHGYEKFNRRQEDWAMVAVSALIRREGDVCADVRIGLTHMGNVPMRGTAVEDALRGQPLNADTIRAAAAHAADGTSPPADLNASQDYKRHLASVLCARALTQAAG